MYHLIGIGGIGMSALARILLQRGYSVKGTDQRTSRIIEELRREGSAIEIGHRSDAVREGDIVVYSTDIAVDHVEMEQARRLRVPMLHRAELLNWICEGRRALLVTGTHGKTTTSALLAAVLEEAGWDPTFAIGGIMRSHQTNGKAGRGPYVVAESDESDGSFLAMEGFGAIVTNLGRDHLNYWKSEEKLAEGFRAFCEQVKSAEHLFWCGDDEALRALKVRGVSYGFREGNECRVTSFSEGEAGVRFGVSLGGKEYEEIELALWGRHNVLNGAAVFGLAMALGIEEGVIRRAFQTFQGTARRLERVGSVQNIEFYDDYGHHPTEIAATLTALRSRVKERRVTALFQPHRFTRFGDLWEKFCEVWGEADRLVVTDVYAAGETGGDETLSSRFVAKMQSKRKEVYFFPRGALEEGVAPLLRPGDAVITFGAGDITGVGRRLMEWVAERKPKLKVGVLFGGGSSEHDVSILSTNNVIQWLDSALYEVVPFHIARDGTWTCGYEAKPSPLKIAPAVLLELVRCDVCLPIFHGQRGEDGMMQGVLEAFDIPYAGCDYRSGALCMHKGWTKQVVRGHGIPIVAHIECSAKEWKERGDEIAQRLRYPVWVKPVHLGSSIGVSRVTGEGELRAAVELAFSLDDVLMIENEIVEAREIEFALLGNDWIRMGAPGEILKGDEVFVAYDKKYGPHAMSAQMPAALTEVQMQLGKELARRAYEACGCQGFARVDFFLDRQGHFWFNEINPIPGCTKSSLYPKMWEAVGVSGQALCNEWIILALHRHRKSKALQGL